MNYTPELGIVDLYVQRVATDATDFTQVTSAATAARTAALPDKSGTIAFTSDIPGGGDVLQDAAGLGITGTGGRLSSAGAPAAPGLDTVAYNHTILDPVVFVTTAAWGETLSLQRDSGGGFLTIASFVAAIVGPTPPDSFNAPLGGAGDQYRLLASGGGVAGYVAFGIASAS